MPYAFISHASACEALRINGLAGEPWPSRSRMLPHRGSCIRLQRDIAQLARTVDLKALGIISQPIDILVPSSSVRSRGKRACTHSWATMIPPASMLRMHKSVIVSTPEFTILQLAHRHVRRIPVYDKMIDRHLAEKELLAQHGIDAPAPVEDLLEWEHMRHIVSIAQTAMEFAGTYRLATPATDVAYKMPQLMTIESALALLDSSYERNDSPRARRALCLAANGSASPMETALFLMLTLPVEMGGFGMPRPELNRSVPVRLGDENLAPDILWREKKLVIEYESEEFHAGLGRDKTDRDIMRANELRSSGYQVLEATPGIACQLPRAKMLVEQVARLLGVVLPMPDDNQRRMRERLHRELFLGNDSR
ncbi:hypothetical protein EII22_09235 [Coriobacteriales bacterium OH1046]|nr:hypothetical protein EII22_09235 [Coriobacteriales bacterium OH1046]